jgi:hypothetical protein
MGNRPSVFHAVTNHRFEKKRNYCPQLASVLVSMRRSRSTWVAEGAESVTLVGGRSTVVAVGIGLFGLLLVHDLSPHRFEKKKLPLRLLSRDHKAPVAATKGSMSPFDLRRPQAHRPGSPISRFTALRKAYSNI